MELKILDGRRSFYQWDLNQKLVVEDDRVEQLHFPTAEENALVCPVYEREGARMADVPNILLQAEGWIKAFAVAGDHTLYARGFRVNPREKPDDYIYTETEIRSVEQVVEQALEQAKESGEWLTDYVKKTDFATAGKPGLVRCGEGLYMSSSTAKINIQSATTANIDAKTTAGRAITPSVLDYAVKSGVCDNAIELKDAEKAAACTWLGTGMIYANEDGSLSVKLADGDTYKVAAVKEG